jgi:hypothetical protein
MGHPMADRVRIPCNMGGEFAPFLKKNGSFFIISSTVPFQRSPSTLDFLREECGRVPGKNPSISPVWSCVNIESAPVFSMVFFGQLINE